jgi:hypothetical protein
MQRVGQTFSNQFFNFILALNAAMAMMNRGGSREQMKKRPTATHAARSPSESQRLGTESRARTVRSGCTRGAWWIHLCWMQAHMVQSSLTVSSQSVSLHARHRVRRCGIRQGAQKHLSRESCNRTGFKTPYILGRYVRKHQFNHQSSPRQSKWPMCLQKGQIPPHYFTNTAQLIRKVIRSNRKLVIMAVNGSKWK